MAAPPLFALDDKRIDASMQVSCFAVCSLEAKQIQFEKHEHKHRMKTGKQEIRDRRMRI